MTMKNQKGSGLILVIVVMAVLMILATTFIMMAFTEGIQTARHYKKIQSYHYAMSGVEFAFETLNNNFLQGNLKDGFPEDLFPVNFYGNLEDGFELGEKNNESITVEIIKDEIGLLIKSVGQIGEVNEVITVRIPRNPNNGGGGGNRPTFPLNKAAYIIGDIIIDGGARIYGDIALGGALEAKNDGRIDGLIENNFTYDLSLPTFPQYPEGLPIAPNLSPTQNGVLTIGQDTTLYGDGQYSKINVVSNSTLTIDVGDNLRIIRVEELNVAGHISIQGTGKLILYVENQIQLNGTLNNLGQNGQIVGDPNQLTIFYGGNNPLNFTNGSDKFVGNLFNKSADIHLSHLDYSGHLITGGNLVTMSNSTRADMPLLYAPYGTVSIEGSTRINGMIIANQLIANNGTRLEFVQASDEELFPELIWGDGGSTGDSFGTPVWGN